MKQEDEGQKRKPGRPKGSGQEHTDPNGYRLLLTHGSRKLLDFEINLTDLDRVIKTIGSLFPKKKQAEA